MGSIDSDVHAELAAVHAELTAALAEIDRLRGLLGLNRPDPQPVTDGRLFSLDTPADRGSGDAAVTRASTADEKLALFRQRFAVRTDVFALRWENPSTGKSGWMPARRGGRDGPPRQLTDEVLRSHLETGDHVGVYPLRPGDTTTVLVCDFDGSTWAPDALAYHDAARTAGLHPLLERSRSGQGAHVWLFFSQPVPAATARQVGAGLLRHAMDQRAELDLGSYDRLFPSQDMLPSQGFGNLIALPLHGPSRRGGTTVFLEPATLKPAADQWAHLAGVATTGPEDLERLALMLDPFSSPNSPRRRLDRTAPVPPVVNGELSAGVSLARAGLPPWLLADLKHLASLPNPAFYEKQRMRFSTWNTPRVIRAYRETIDRLELPRGLLDQTQDLLHQAGSDLSLVDRRPTPKPVHFRFHGELRPEQQEAVEAIATSEHGMIIAPPGTGKTVIGCALIARHRTPTLVLVDRRPLADQWRARLAEFLDLAPRQIGQTGGGRKRITGIVDIAMLQALARRPEEAAEIFGRYGLVIVDECHHAPAVSYEAVLAAATTRRWIGLTATPFRADRLDPLIGFYCGPIRHQVTAAQTPTAELPRELTIHRTTFRLDHETPHIQDVFRALSTDPGRTAQIVGHIAELAQQRRRILVLSQRKDHLQALDERLRAMGLDPVILVGGRNRRDSRAALDNLTDRTQQQEGVIALATGSYLGEGFDLPGLDTLVLAFPVSFKGKIIQYVGRLLRPDPTKTTITVHDYHDPHVPVLVAMARKRLTTYRQLGFTTPNHLDTNPVPRPDDAF